jgi:hypothetical protein
MTASWVRSRRRAFSASSLAVLLPLGDFRLKLSVQFLSRFGEFMLTERAEQQGFVQFDHGLMDLGGLGHLNHDAHEQFVRQKGHIV